jgi:titin
MGTSTPVSAPAAPSNLTATAVSGSQIDLAWTDNASTEGAFEVWRGTSPGTGQRIATLGANTVRFSDFGVLPATTYYYSVRARNASGVSPYSNVASATTPP